MKWASASRARSWASKPGSSPSPGRRPQRAAPARNPELSDPELEERPGFRERVIMTTETLEPAAAPASPQHSRGNRKQARRNTLIGWTFILPNFLGFLAF